MKTRCCQCDFSSGWLTAIGYLVEDAIIFVEKKWLHKYCLSLVHKRINYAIKALAGHKNCSRSSAIQAAPPTFGFHKELSESMQEATSQLSHRSNISIASFHACPAQSRVEIAHGFLGPQPKPPISPKLFGVEVIFFPWLLAIHSADKWELIIATTWHSWNYFSHVSTSRYTGFTI